MSFFRVSTLKKDREVRVGWWSDDGFFWELSSWGRFGFFAFVHCKMIV